jgi:hypothetical protein
VPVKGDAEQMRIEGCDLVWLKFGRRKLLNMKHCLLPVYALALSLMGAASASATVITTPGLSVVSGPLTFSSFTCSVNGTNLFVADCNAVSAAAIAGGIMFTSSLSTTGVSSAEAALTFDVADAAGINTVGLTFNSNFLGMQVNSVSEFIYSGSTLVGTAIVYCGYNTGCLSSTTDLITLSGTYTNLYVTKDINLSGFVSNAPATTGSISIISQTYSNVITTPEPVTIPLIGGGLALLGVARLRRRKA